MNSDTIGIIIDIAQSLMILYLLFKVKDLFGHIENALKNQLGLIKVDGKILSLIKNLARKKTMVVETQPEQSIKGEV